MRIIDQENKRVINSILILLTPNEALELANYIKNLNTSNGDHCHVDDLEYKREITLAVYTENNQHFFSTDVQKIIAEG